MSFKSKFRLLLTGSFAAMLAQGAWAQDVVASQPSDSERVDTAASPGEIVVTATRQAQALSKVPISITAFDQEALDKQGAKSIDDLTRLTPGLMFDRSGYATTSTISIRGISSDVGAGTVGIYIDDTPIQTRAIGSNNVNAYPALFDLERVEVLRGPQGTLFGAGSMGGTVRFITPDPGLQDWSGYGRAELAKIDGGGVNYEGGAAIGGPIIEDKIGFRVSAWWRRDGGFVDRVDQDTFAVIDKNANKQNSFVTRAALAFQPTENLKITPSVFYQNIRLSDVSTFWDKNEAGEQMSFPGDNIYRNGQILRQPDRDRLLLPALKVEYSFGDVDLITNTSYFWRRQQRQDDLTNTNPGLFRGTNRAPFPGYVAFSPAENSYKAFTQEVRLQSSDPNARLTWVVGAFYTRSVQKALQTIVDPQFEELLGFPIEFFSPGAPELLPGGLTVDARNRFVDEQIAGFANVSYEIVDGLKATVGLRVAHAKVKGRNVVDGPYANGHVDDAVSGSETPVTPKIGLNWQVDSNNLFYASASKGYRAGGLNLNIPPVCDADLALRGLTEAPTSFGSDSLWSYEIGSKNRLFDGATTIAASAYHIVWKDIQRNDFLSGCAFNYVTNSGKAVSNGFDFQITQRIGENLTLSGSLAYTDAHYVETILTPPDPVTGAQSPVVRKGNSVLFQPWTATASAEYVQPIGDDSAYVRVDYQYRGGRRTTPITDPTVASFSPNRRPPEATNTFDLRIGYTHNDLDVSVFAKNLTNDHPALAFYREGGDPVFRQSTLVPRTIGITAAFRY